MLIGDGRIIHFALFVNACIATHKWRKEANLARTERRNIELQYHRSPEEHMAQQPPSYTPASDVKHASRAGEESPTNEESAVKWA